MLVYLKRIHQYITLYTIYSRYFDELIKAINLLTVINKILSVHYFSDLSSTSIKCVHTNLFLLFLNFNGVKSPIKQLLRVWHGFVLYLSFHFKDTIFIYLM